MKDSLTLVPPIAQKVSHNAYDEAHACGGESAARNLYANGESKG
jgi:hypothetical protein